MVMQMKVGGRCGALVRVGVDKDSAQVGLLARDTRVTVTGEAVASDGTARAELESPLRGWVSLSSLVAASPATGASEAVEPSIGEYEELFRRESARGERRESFGEWSALAPVLVPCLAGRHRVLDVGCGTSGIVAALVALGSGPQKGASNSESLSDHRGVTKDASTLGETLRRDDHPEVGPPT